MARADAAGAPARRARRARFAIDEDPSLVVRGCAWSVAGAGFFYELARDGDGVRMRVHTAGTTGG